MQVDVPGRSEPLHPDQLILRLRCGAHRGQHLRSGRPGHGWVGGKTSRALGVSGWSEINGCLLSVKVRASTTSESFAAAQGRGIAPSLCSPRTCPKQPVLPCASLTVDCSAFSWARECSGSECDSEHVSSMSPPCLHTGTLVHRGCRFGFREYTNTKILLAKCWWPSLSIQHYSSL